MEVVEKSEISKKESVSYDSKKDTSKRPELKSSVMAKKVERKLYPEPQVERKVSVVEPVVKPVVEVIKEEEEVVVVEPGTEGAPVEETENSGSGSSKVSISTSVFKTHPLILQENKAPLKKSAKAEKPSGDVSPHIPLSAMAGYDFPFLNHFLGGGKKKEAIPEPPKSKPPR